MIMVVIIAAMILTVTCHNVLFKNENIVFFFIFRILFVLINCIYCITSFSPSFIGNLEIDGF